jgi:hypothetical protein
VGLGSFRNSEDWARMDSRRSSARSPGAAGPEGTPGFISVEETETAGSRGGLERNREAGRLIDCCEFSGDLLNLALHYEIDGGGLDGPETTLTPFGDSHLFDEIHFELGRGLQLVNVGLQQALEAIARFIGEDQAVGGASVARRVLRTDEFAFNGAGSATLGAVGAR